MNLVFIAFVICQHIWKGEKSWSTTLREGYLITPPWAQKYGRFFRPFLAFDRPKFGIGSPATRTVQKMGKGSQELLILLSTLNSFAKATISLYDFKDRAKSCNSFQSFFYVLGKFFVNFSKMTWKAKQNCTIKKLKKG